MRTGLLFIAVATILIAGCKREQADEIDFGYDYLPLVVGQSIDYHVDSTVYDDFSSLMVFHSDFSVSLYHALSCCSQSACFSQKSRKVRFAITRTFACYRHKYSKVTKMVTTSSFLFLPTRVKTPNQRLLDRLGICSPLFRGEVLMDQGMICWM